MISDTLIKRNGMRAEPFDYTIWQRDLYKNMSVKELYDKIKERMSKPSIYLTIMQINYSQKNA